jgi:hypothetical protein
MPLLIGADHGVGAWRSHIKVFTKGPSERRLFHEKTLLAQKEASPERGFRVLQTAEIYCRKDDPVVLTSTVTQCLDDGYDLLIGSQLLVLVCKKRGVREPMFIPRNASEMTIVSSPSSRMGMLEQVYVQYKVTGGDGVASFATYFREVSTLMVLAEDTIIALTVPYFCLFVTGDLSFYADSLGKSKSCSYWCMYCTLTRIQWNEPNAERGALWTEERARDIRLNVLRHRTVPSAERMGITSVPHYRSITIDMYPPPPCCMVIWE